jgi:hypothetical protein
MAVGLVLAAGQRGPAAAAGPSRFRAVVDSSANLPPEVLSRLKESPHSYFRFVNKLWTQAVCDEYSPEIGRLPQVRLHGDAHVEQYAVTADSRGLDDFDDSALGPAVVDIVRFLGSLQLVARQVGWQQQERTFVDAFFRGYERALANPAYTPREPAVARRLRAQPTKTPEEFLSWAESLMTVGSEATMQVLERGLAPFRRYALEQVPGLTESHIAIKKYGVIQMGIGSALTRKVLLRVEGPTAAPDDDVIIEAKELARLDSASCVSVPPPVEAFRVVTAASQLGRLHHSFLVVVPSADRGNPTSPGWWVRSWDRTYRELEIADIKAPVDLQQVAEDAGAQLGGANTRPEPGIDDAEIRKKELAAVRKLRAQMRRTVARLSAEVFEAWQALRAQ